MYPLLLLFFPILYFYSENADRMGPQEMILPAIAAVVFFGVSYLIARLLMQDVQKGLLLCFISFLLLASFRPVATLIAALIANRQTRESVVLAGLALLIAAAVLVIHRIRFSLIPLSRFLTISLIALVAIQGVVAYSRTPATEQFTLRQSAAAVKGVRPNIYYVILDGFGRADQLQEVFGHDSGPFLARMQELGFFIPPRSNSNYPSTVFSLASTLNMRYLDDVAEKAGAKSRDRSPVKNLIRENAVVAALKKLGYRIYFLPSGYSGVDLAQDDVRLTSPFHLSEFQNLLLNLSPLPATLRLFPWNEIKYWQYSAHRARVSFSFQKLAQLGEDADAPRFVFAHIVSPHPPFIFRADGTPRNPGTQFSFDDGSHFTRGGKRRKEYLEGYAAQVNHVERMLVEAAQHIVAADPTAIIIFQGDHGPGSHLDWKNADRTNLKERFSIFNAYRVPPEVRARLSESVTPVNTFRTVLDYIRGTQTDLLPDRSYFFLWSKPYRFIDVTEKLR